MLFNSLIFLYLFLPITYLIFWRLTTKNGRYLWLTVTGYIFYSFWNYKFCSLMALSTLVSYCAGLGFLRWTDPRRRKMCLILPLTFDLLLLGFFKYTNFLIDTVNQAIAAFHGGSGLPLYEIVLPIGISFYTFHTISYIVDSYRGVITPTRNLFEFSCYVSLFSQLVAGPIVRFREIEADLESIGRAQRRRGLNIGWSFIVIGMSKKVLLADSIAAIINPAFAQWRDLSTLSAWLCALGYSYQLYFDFSGYSDMAVGLGHLFGLRLPQNFNSPYQAVDISDFWRRWHMSLSRVLRDYIYIPLGGSHGSVRKMYRNLMVTMILGGLWHGAAWTFVFWGAYHGALLVAGKVYGNYWERLPETGRRIGTFLLVVIGWVFFRSESFAMATTLLHAMFVWQPGVLLTGAPLLTGLLLLAAVLAHAGRNSFEIRHEWTPVPALGLAALFAFSIVAIYGEHQSPFLYFQF
ncbi:MAG: MBOAT family O-acyltransferase [Bryobacteraceae bacterium]